MLGALLAGCGGGAGGGGAESPPPIVAAPQISTQPQPQSVPDGAAASFSVAASGTGLAYQWQRNGTDVPGATSTTLNLAAVALSDDGARLRVVVGNAGGSVTSNEVRLTVTPVAPSIATAPAAASVTAGQTATFAVVARGSAPLGYQWLRDGAQISGATTPTFATPATAQADNGAGYSVRVSNAAGSVTSPVAVLTVVAAVSAPQITAQPLSTSVVVGGVVTFRVVATGTAMLAYQWRRNGVAIAGATADSYTTPVLSASDTGAAFSVLVSNAAGSVVSADGVLTVTAAAPTSPLAGRAWSPAVQLAGGVASQPLAALADDGRAVVVSATQQTLPAFPFLLQTPIVVLGEPGGAGAVRWSAQQTLASFGTRSGASAPTDLRVAALRVAPNGRALILATGNGGGCPGSTADTSTSCRFVAVLDPVQRTWSPWDVVAPLAESLRGDILSVALNDRGDVALYFPSSAVPDPVARVYWRSASEVGFRVLNITGQPFGPQLGELTLDDAGGLVLATQVVQGGTTDIVVWRGSVAAGFAGPAVADTRASPATLRALRTGRSGRSFLLWTQDNGSGTSLYASRFDAAATSVQAQDMGSALLAALPQQPAGAVGDDDVLIVPRYISDIRNPMTTCAMLRWPFAGAASLLDAPAPCNLPQNASTDWASERGGNVLSHGLAFNWATYDAALNRQVDASIDTSAVASGPGYAIGVRRPPSIGSSKVALSRSGIGLLVLTANLDVWPTPATPNGDGRPTVANLWATYFK
jgi:hypothetical protein